MNLAEALRDPKQRTMVGVAGVALVVAAVLIGRSLFSSGGAAPPNPTLDAAVQTLQPDSPPQPSASEIEQEAAAQGDQIDMTPGSGKKIRKNP